MTLAESCRYEGRPEFSIAPFRAAIAPLGTADTPDLVSRHTEAANRLATTLIQLERDSEAEPVLDQALRVARRSGADGHHARLATQLALIFMRRNELERLRDLGARGRLLRVADTTYSDAPLNQLLPRGGSS